MLNKVKADASLISNKNWYAVLGHKIEQELIEKDKKVIVDEKVNVYAFVKTSDLQDTSTQLEEIENKSPVFKLISDIFRTRGKNIDEKFELLTTQIKQEDNIRDF